MAKTSPVETPFGAHNRTLFDDLPICHSCDTMLTPETDTCPQCRQRSMKLAMSTRLIPPSYDGTCTVPA